MDPHRKAKSAQQKRDYSFHESLAPTLPVAPSVDITRGIPVGYALAALWVVAAVTAGVGLGLLLVRADRAPVATAPYPVTSVTLKVAPAAGALTIGRPITVSQPNLTVKPALAVAQAQAGSPLKVASVSYLQAASTSATLQPGYTPYTRQIQGTVGTGAVTAP